MWQKISGKYVSDNCERKNLLAINSDIYLIVKRMYIIQIFIEIKFQNIFKIYSFWLRMPLWLPRGSKWSEVLISASSLHSKNSEKATLSCVVIRWPAFGSSLGFRSYWDIINIKHPTGGWAPRRCYQQLHV